MGKSRGFYHADCLFYLWGWEGNGKGRVTDYLLGTDQKIPDWFIKITLLGEVKTSVKSGIMSRSGIVDFRTRGIVGFRMPFFSST